MSIRPAWYIEDAEGIHAIRLTVTQAGMLLLSPRYRSGVYTPPIALDQEEIRKLRDACDEALWKELPPIEE